MLTGSQLFPHSNPAVVISRHLNSSPPSLADQRPDLAGLDPVLAVALSKHPEDRFVRCAEFARALAELATTGTPPSPLAVTKAAPAMARTNNGDSRTAAGGEPPHLPAGGRNPRRWLVPTAALTVIVLAGVIALTWQPWKKGPSSAPIAPIATVPSITNAPSTPSAASQPLARHSIPLRLATVGDFMERSAVRQQQQQQAAALAAEQRRAHAEKAAHA